jgi:hypothetical protein
VPLLLRSREVFIEQTHSPGRPLAISAHPISRRPSPDSRPQSIIYILGSPRPVAAHFILLVPGVTRTLYPPLRDPITSLSGQPVRRQYCAHVLQSNSESLANPCSILKVDAGHTCNSKVLSVSHQSTTGPAKQSFVMQCM